LIDQAPCFILAFHSGKETEQMRQKPFFKTERGELYLGDCLELLPEVPTESVDMILSDLPYGVTDLPWDKKLPLEPVWREFMRILKERGIIILMAQQAFATDLINMGRKIFRYELIWEKTLSVRFWHAKYMPLRAHENILVFYRKRPVYHPQMTEGKPYANKEGGMRNFLGRDIRNISKSNKGQRYPRSVLRFSSAGAKRSGHPTEKPLALFEWLIRTYSDEGGLVLDCCAGSGTTAVAAEKLDRQWLMMEKEPEFCSMAKRRLEELVDS
jgi:site-specific DNA-methyltransferase (adenine-specific)